MGRFTPAIDESLEEASVRVDDAAHALEPDGTLLLRSPFDLGPYPDKLTERLEHWAQAAPDRIFLAQRRADGTWRTLSYAATLAQVRAVAQACAANPVAVAKAMESFRTQTNRDLDKLTTTVSAYFDNVASELRRLNEEVAKLSAKKKGLFRD